MILLKCHVAGFGKLIDFSYTFTPDINIICEKNSFGKSTLASFIRVMFYGFEGEKTRGDEYNNERKRFKPWDGEVYGGNISFEYQNRRYSLSRTFGNKEKDDEFQLIDLKTNLPSSDFTTKIGEEIFGLDSASFMRSIFISQNDCSTGTTDGITARLGDLSEDSTDVRNYEEADRKLNDYLNSMSPNRKTGELSRMKSEMIRLQAELLDKDAIEAELVGYNNEHTRTEEEIRQCEEGIAMLETKQGEISKQKDLSAIKAKKDSMEASLVMQKNQIDRAEKMYAEMEASYRGAKKINDTVRDKNDKKKSSRMFSIFFFIGIIILMGVGMYFLQKNHMLTGPVIAAFFLVIGVVLIAQLVSRRRRPKTTDDSDDIDMGRSTLIAYKESIDERYEAYDKLKAEYDAYMEENGTVMEGIDGTLPGTSLVAVSDELKGAYTRLDELRKQLGNSEKNIENQQKKLDRLAEIDIELDELSEEYETKIREYHIVEITREKLMEAKNLFTAKYVGPMKDSFDKYLEILNDQCELSFSMDARMNLSINDRHRVHSSKYLSAGLRDLTGICMRMAMADAMFTEDKPFIIADDPFVNLDETGIAGGLQFLETVSSDYQIIYFTCHSDRT